MKIEYLESYSQREIFKGRTRNGLPLARIEELEAILNSSFPFPRAFREYLYLGGDYNALGFDPGGYFENGDDLIHLKEYYEQRMRQHNVSISRPYIIFDSYHGDCFGFIYLDEGDNPQPYNFGVDPDYRDDDGSVIYKYPDKTFKDLIDDMVRRALLGLTAR